MIIVGGATGVSGRQDVLQLTAGCFRSLYGKRSRNDSGGYQRRFSMCKNSVRWLYRLGQNFSWESGIPFERDRAYRDKSGRVRLIIEAGGRITVTRGYSWNGCSPKFCLFDVIIGTPDGVVHAVTGRPKTYFASLIHDALYQFLRVDPPVTRSQADACFLRLMAESDFFLRYIYWGAVRAFGWLVWQGKKSVRKWEGNAFDLP